MMTPSIHRQATLQALKCLKDSGERSVEKLTATLLSRLIGFPIRLCKSGYQAGIDAMADPAEIPVAIEDKRYQSGPLDLGDLEGKLAAAARTYPDLQLWALATTVEVSPLSEQALRDTGENLGLAVLILDSAAAQTQLPGISSIVALCASAPDETLNALSTPEWLDAKLRVNMPPLDVVRDELETIRALPRFTEWLNRFRAQLTDLPLWSLVTSRQNRRLTRILEEDAETIFGTDFYPSKLVPRTVKSELNPWFAAAMATSEPTLAVILGERYDGKTWLVFDWLKDTLATLPVPVFFIGSKREKSSAKDLTDHILEDIKRVLGSFERHASTTLKRQRDIKAGSTPWCVIVLDGLNEYAPNPDRWLAHLAWAIGRTDLDARPCAVIATVRQRSWQELADRVRLGVQEIHIGPYDDTEFRVALKLQDLPTDYLQAIPENAREMVRRPRYFDLVIKHKDKLGRYDAITPEVLYWLDLCDKIRSRRAPASGWDEEHFQGVLMGLAARCNLFRSLSFREVRSEIGEFTPDSDIEAILYDLRSEGVLIKTGTSYRLSAERFALARGLYLVEEELCTAYVCGVALTECLRDFLATLRETEEMVACLRAAVTIALFSDPPKPHAVIDALVHEWLGLRNLLHTDLSVLEMSFEAQSCETMVSGWKGPSMSGRNLGTSARCSYG
jgi:hypothetical protein